MLKYLLSTFCVFLFFEDVRLNNYKCASPDCSVLITGARVKHAHPAKSHREVNVQAGTSVDIYGIDPENEHYLVKVKEQNKFYLLPKSLLKENNDVSSMAKVDAEDPFLPQHQAVRTTPPTNQEQLCKNEPFYSRFLNVSYPLSGVKAVSDVDQSPKAGNVEKPELPGAAAQKTPNNNESGGVAADKIETPGKNVENVEKTKLRPDAAAQKIPNNNKSTDLAADKTKTSENNSASEDNKSDSWDSESNTLNGTDNYKSDQVDSTAENHNQKSKNVTEENDDVIIEDVDEDSVESKNESAMIDAGLETEPNPSKSSTSTPSKEKPNQFNIKPKVSVGDDPLASSDNVTSNENRTLDVKNESSLNPTQPSVNRSHSTIFKTAEENETKVVEPNNSTSKQNDTIQNTTSPGSSSSSSSPDKTYETNDQNMPPSSGRAEESGSSNKNVSSDSSKSSDEEPISKSDDPKRSNERTVPDKLVPSNKDEYSDSNMKEASSKPDVKKEDVSTAIPPVLSSEVKDEVESNRMKDQIDSSEKPLDSSQEKEQNDTIQNTTSPGSSSSSSSPDKTYETNDQNMPPSSGRAEESGSSNKNVSDSSKSSDEEPTLKTARPSSPPSPIVPSTSTDKPRKSDDPKNLASLTRAQKPGPPPKNAQSNSEESNEAKQTQVPRQPTAQSDFTSPNSSGDKFSKSDDPKRSNERTVPDKPVPSNKNEYSDSNMKEASSKPAVKKEDVTTAIPPVLSSEVKDEVESNRMKDQIDSSEKPLDSSQEKDNESTSSENTNGLPAGQKYEVPEDSNQSLEEVISREESAFYTDIFTYIPDFSSVFENLAVLQSYFNFEWLQKQNDSAEQQHCDEESCSAFSIFDSMAKYGFDVSAINLQSWSLAEVHQSKQTSLVAGILLCTVLLFSTLISMLRNSKKKSRINSLISVVNRLEKKLLVATKEISLLEEQLTDAPVTLISQPAAEVDYESSELLLQIELLQVRNTDLEDKVTYLEKELHNVTTSAFEMHKLLENSLSTQAQSRLAEDEVDTLRALTERQDRQIEDLMREMDAIVIENRYLKDDLKKMEKEFNSQTKKNLELSEKNRNLSLRLDQQIEETATTKSNYKSEIYQLQAKIEDLEINLRRSEFQVESLNRAFLDKHENKSDDQMQALQDDVQLKLQLATLKAMNNELSAELKEQKNARRTLDDHIGDVIRKCNELTQALEVSEKGRNEAVNKLQVLTDYFNEKESQLQKEISAKEKLFMESENKDQLLSQKLSSLKEEIKNNKDRNEELKKEIEAQERSFKTQLATAEQKSRDLWFALRQAERKYQESEKEAATLRNKILILENNLSSANQKLNDKHSTNGDVNGQSLMFSAEMLSYRGPNDFIPPPPSPLASHSPEFFPPEPSYSPDERLPPLGGRRVPSPPSLIVPPPEDDDFKPPLPHAQYMPGRSRHDSLNMSYYGDNVQYN